MKARTWILLFAGFLLLVGGGWSYLHYVAVGVDMTRAANEFLQTLDERQRATAQLEFETPQRVDWHFIPKDHRKGLQIKDMSERQRQAAHGLLKSCLSDVGYGKAVKIMELEHILHELERERTGGPIRDTQRYYFTIFGPPGEQAKWGLSIEGHHLSLNFVVEQGRVISSTPTFFAANPAIVKSDVPGGLDRGTRVLAREEEFAFSLVNSLDQDQRKIAIFADQAPREIRAAGASQPPDEDPIGLAFSEMSQEQQQTLKQLVTSYLENVPDEVREARVDALRAAGPENVHFAWAGATKPGVGHYYRIQGPTFLIEFVNTQPDPAGNPANHIHCVWRDMRGDFALPLSAAE